MVKKNSQRKKPAAKKRKAWHLTVAYSLGKVARKATRSGRKKTRSSLSWEGEAPLTPVLKEIKAIADISGLTAAVEEMNRISLKHSRHPVIERVVARVRELPPEEQEALARKFVEKLNAAVYSGHTLAAFPGPVKLTEEECQKMSARFIECLSGVLEDIGLPEADRAVFEKLTNDISRPLHELMQFYMSPGTFGQKVKRLWRMQRILIRVISLARITQARAFEGPVLAPGQRSPNYWVNDLA